jgi:uncharacterized protein (DUF1501 family)
MSTTRRDFLKSAVGMAAGLSVPATVPAFFHRAAWAAAATEPTDRVLVVVQLSGGNDGLNTVVPYGDDAYGRSRRTLRLSGSEVHKIDEMVGFHPQMPAFHEMFREGQLSVVQGVGYPKNDRDHEGAMRDWHTARPGDTTCQTGWVGRTLDVVKETRTSGISGALVASAPQPFALNARGAVVPSVTQLQNLVFRESPAEKSGVSEFRGDGGRQDQAKLADLVRHGMNEAKIVNQHIQERLADSRGAGDYPSLGLAQQLQTAAQLIRANLGIRILFAECGSSGGGIGGFDNHANQRDNHASLLRELSLSLKAFVDDLQRQQLLDRVLVMTFSEFGRTLAENGRRGTGHGAAAPVFLAGGSLKGGFVGERPSLTDLEQGAPKHHTDYRQLYATVLDQWLQLDSEAVLGARYTPLKLFA